MQEITYKVHMIIYPIEPNGLPNYEAQLLNTTQHVTVHPGEVPEDAEPEDYAAEWAEFVIRERENIHHGHAHIYVGEYTEFDWLKQNNAPRLPI